MCFPDTENDLINLLSKDPQYQNLKDLVLYLYHMEFDKPYVRYRTLYLLFEWRFHKENSGACILYWCNGSVFKQLISIHFSFKEDPFKRDKEEIFDACLIGCLDYLQSTVLKPLEDIFCGRELHLLIFLERSNFYGIEKTKRFLDLHRSKEFTDNLFSLHTLLLDQSFSNKILFHLMDENNRKIVWDKKKLMEARRDIIRYALGYVMPDFEVTKFSDLLCMRRPYVFKSKNKKEIQKMVQSILSKEFSGGSL